MKAYSEDLRQKIVQALGRGISKSQAARLFDVSLSSVKRYARLARQGSSLAPKKGTGRPPKIDQALPRSCSRKTSRSARRPLFLTGATSWSISRARPSATRPSGGSCGAWASAEKKDCVGAVERDEFLRAAWKVMVAQKLEAKRFVFVDEMGTNISLSTLHAWALIGERACWSVPRKTVGRTRRCFRA